MRPLLKAKLGRTWTRFVAKKKCQPQTNLSLNAPKTVVKKKQESVIRASVKMAESIHLCPVYRAELSTTQAPVISPAKELKRFNALPTAAVSSRKRIASKSPQIFCEETLSKGRMMLDMSSGAVVWDPKTLVGRYWSLQRFAHQSSK